MRKGFTLIELLLVVTIIAILSGVLITVLDPGAQRDRVRDELAKKNLTNLSGAVESYYSSEGEYPSSSADAKFVNYFVSEWPDNDPEGSTYFYDSPDGTSYVAYVSLSFRPDYCYKISNTSSVVERCATVSCNLSDASCTAY